MYNKTIVSLENAKKFLKKHTYSPNNTRHASFGLFVIVVAFQHPPSRVLRRLKLVVVRVVVVVVVVVHVAVIVFVV